MAAQRKSARKSSDLLFLVVAGGLIYYFYRTSLPPLSWGLIGLAVVLCWISFLMPTYCDYAIRSGGYCRHRVRGKLRGCRYHGRDKRDAIFAVFGARNPGRAIRTQWGTSAAPPPRFADGPPATAPVQQKPGDAIMLVCTVVSAVAGVAALF